MSDAGAQIQRLTEAVDELRSALAGLAERQDLSDEEQAEAREAIGAATSALHEPPIELIARVHRAEGRIESHDRMIAVGAGAGRPARTGVAGVIDASADHATRAVEGLSDRGFRRLVVLAVLACLVLLFVAVVLVARNSGYNVTTSGPVHVDDAGEVRGGPVRVAPRPEAPVPARPQADGPAASIPPPPPYTGPDEGPPAE